MIPVDDITKGLVLAAGRGSRMGGLTEEHPKCLTELVGRPLLDWQVSAMRTAGVDPIAVVTGYRGHALKRRGLITIENPEWSTSNMVVSLLYAAEYIDKPTIVSYSDIVYSSEPVSRLMQSNDDFVLAYDTQWLELWSRRFDNPLADAESFSISDDGIVLDIGRKVARADEIMGQYMGLFKITPVAMQWLADLIADLPELRNGLDMTAMIHRLLERGKRVSGVPVVGGWCEVDSPTDLAVAEALWQEGTLPLVQEKEAA